MRERGEERGRAEGSRHGDGRSGKKTHIKPESGADIGEKGN